MRTSLLGDCLADLFTLVADLLINIVIVRQVIISLVIEDTLDLVGEVTQIQVFLVELATDLTQDFVPLIILDWV